MVSKEKKVTEMNRSYVRQEEQKQKRQQAQTGRHRRGLVRRLTALGVVGAAMAVVFAVLLTSQLTTLEAKKTERAQLEQKMENLKAEEAELEQKVKNYNDLDYIAEIARRDYYLTKPGETLYKVPEKTAESAD
ncbi:FtsB family cell division protein [Salibacterium halotolerans]|uniref:Cell division protein DivIC n=1 Tax=Salibacterium halotolerans TaxID=1884432 RepID=A0A1I5WLE4_9BACI|nr:septum formation initiator family protein [Salibacterium halotolerans]SFQ20397.1 cell division protein DivIC [Salibacterium halotolerans]